jgi:hypothetical protein
MVVLTFKCFMVDTWTELSSGSGQTIYIYLDLLMEQGLVQLQTR